MFIAVGGGVEEAVDFWERTCVSCMILAGMFTFAILVGQPTCFAQSSAHNSDDEGSDSYSRDAGFFPSVGEDCLLFSQTSCWVLFK